MKRPKTRGCGRCKKRYKVYDREDGEFEVNAIAPAHIGKTSGYLQYRLIHLCPKCMGELSEWVNEYEKRGP